MICQVLAPLVATLALGTAAPPSGAEAPPLRIALVRVDDHAWWFGGFFNPYDEARLERIHPRSARRNRLVREVSLPIPGVSADKTFENFVVGSCNELAHAAALAAVEKPGEPQYNPLFIYGATASDSGFSATT